MLWFSFYKFPWLAGSPGGGVEEPVWGLELPGNCPMSSYSKLAGVFLKVAAPLFAPHFSLINWRRQLLGHLVANNQGHYRKHIIGKPLFEKVTMTSVQLLKSQAD